MCQVYLSSSILVVSAIVLCLVLLLVIGLGCAW